MQDLFNATEWAELFVDAGARYTVFLTKHHDGYTLWPSATSPNWNTVDVGPNRDVTGEVNAAVKAAGLHSGLYHSLFEWYNPAYLADKAANFNTTNFVSKTMDELVDLVKRYEPDVIWSDGEGRMGNRAHEVPPQTSAILLASHHPHTHPAQATGKRRIAIGARPPTS